MATNAKDIIAAHATHPGSVLKSELQARGIKQKDSAKAIGMPAPNLSELIKGKRHVTESIAIKLEEALGIPFQTWMNLQNRYHYVARRREELDAAEAMAAREEQSLRLRLNLAEIYNILGSMHPLRPKGWLRSSIILPLTLTSCRRWRSIQWAISNGVRG